MAPRLWRRRMRRNPLPNTVTELCARLRKEYKQHDPGGGTPNNSQRYAGRRSRHVRGMVVFTRQATALT